MRIPQIPMEWMDPMSWRLPSGKALAEFALQAGFLAPLMLGTPNFKKKKKMAATAVDGGDIKAIDINMDLKAMDIKAADAGGRDVGRMDVGRMDVGGMEKQRREGPETSGTFRNNTGRGTGREAK
jgi:hypothetical protein